MLTTDQPLRLAPLAPRSETGFKPTAIAPISGSGPQISDEQRAAFRRDGFLVLSDLTTPEEIASLRVVYDRLFAERHKRFASDHPWNLEKATAREQREFRALPPLKRLWWRVQRRMRGYA